MPTPGPLRAVLCPRAFPVLAALVLAVYSPPAAATTEDFSCDFDASRGGLSVDGSCDASSDYDGSFDYSCDFSYDDDRSDTSVSADFDASCDALSGDRLSCDYSSSFDYDAPGRSVSGSLSCDTIEKRGKLVVRCSDAQDRPDVNEFFEQLKVKCSDPYEIPYFVLAELGNQTTVIALIEEMQVVLQEIAALQQEPRMERKLEKASKQLGKASLMLEGERPAKAQKRYEKAQKRLRRLEADLTEADVNRLCEASLLYCG